VSRSDDERLVDIHEAASEIEALVAGGREAWDQDRIKRLAAERCWRSLARPLAP
jgi:hypothetical protein